MFVFLINVGEKKIIERVHNMKAASRKRQDDDDGTPKSRGRPKKAHLYWWFQ